MHKFAHLFLLLYVYIVQDQPSICYHQDQPSMCCCCFISPIHNLRICFYCCMFTQCRISLQCVIIRISLQCVIIRINLQCVVVVVVLCACCCRILPIYNLRICFYCCMFPQYRISLQCVIIRISLQCDIIRISLQCVIIRITLQCVVVVCVVVVCAWWKLVCQLQL